MPSMRAAWQDHGDRSFDELTRAVGQGRLSRRRALRLGGGAVLGGMLGSLGLGLRPQVAPAAGRCLACSVPLCFTQVDPDCGVPPSKYSNRECACVESVNGKTCCVVAHCGASGKGCNQNSDCGRKQVCSSTAKECCEVNINKAGICVRACKASVSGTSVERRRGSGDIEWMGARD